MFLVLFLEILAFLFQIFLGTDNNEELNADYWKV